MNTELIEARLPRILSEIFNDGVANDDSDYDTVELHDKCQLEFWGIETDYHDVIVKLRQKMTSQLEDCFDKNEVLDFSRKYNFCKVMYFYIDDRIYGEYDRGRVNCRLTGKI